jgi:hypothetical protein
MGKTTRTDEIPLQPPLALEPFYKWGLDFIGLISPASNNKEYILVFIDDLKKWVEVKALQFSKDGNVTKFLYEGMFIRYGVPREIVIDQGH